MINNLLLIVLMFFQFSCSSTNGKKEEKVEMNNVVDPEVISRVEGMGQYLRGLKKFEVTSKSTFDVVLENEQKTEFEAKTRYIIQRPDKLFAEIESDRKNRQYFYDGKKFTLYSPKEKFYGEIPFNGQLANLVKKLNEYGIEVPLSDLFIWGTEEANSKKVSSAMYLNEEKKGKESHDHFAIRQDTIDWQVWIKKGESPLPKKVQYEINNDSARPKVSSLLEWNLKPEISRSTFEFKPPKDSQKIKLEPARKPEDIK